MPTNDAMRIAADSETAARTGEARIREVRVETRAGAVRSVMTALDVREAVAILREMSGNNFAAGLVADDYQWRNRGGLIGNKANWAIVVAQEELDRRRRTATAAERPAGPVLTGDFAALSAIFTRAVRPGPNGRRRMLPKITLETDNGRTVVLAVAGERSRAPGSINVTDDRRYPDNTWYGRIETDGTWRGGRAADEAVLDLLRRFAADPAGVAAEYGRAMGSCCFCRRALTDPRSILVGYGEICAHRFGLPWGHSGDHNGQSGDHSMTLENATHDDASDD
jgi:hypothetical protein